MWAESLAIAAGFTLGVAVLLLFAAFRRPTPDLRDVLRRRRQELAVVAAPIRPSTPAAAAPGPGGAGGAQAGEAWSDRVGRAVLLRTRGLPGTVPHADLDILGITPGRFAVQKVTGFLLGLLIPPLFGLVADTVGVAVPLAAPALLGIALGAAGWMFPHVAARRDAKIARDRFGRTITAYYDLVVLDRLGGAAMEAALTEPAALCHDPLFRRIQQALARQRLERRPSPQALQQLADNLGIPQLRDLANTIELASERGAPVAEILQARAKDIRNSALNADVERAAATSQRQVAVTATLLVCFMAFLLVPVVLRILGGG